MTLNRAEPSPSAWARAAIIVVGCFLGALLSLLIGVAAPPFVVRNDLGADTVAADPLYDPVAVPSGFSPPETASDGTTYRTVITQATLTFPFAANAGRYAHVTVRLAAPQQSVAEQDTAELVTVTLLLNGRASSTFGVAPNFGVYSATLDTAMLPNPYLDPAHVQVDVQTIGSSGVRVDWLELRLERDFGAVAFGVGLWALLILMVMAVAMRRLGWRWSLLYGLGALLTLAILGATYVPRGLTPTVEAALAGVAWLLAAWLAPGGRPVWGFVPAFCGVWLVPAGRVLGEWQLDDAYISYRYAWNLVQGHGLVYNPGEVVEGYTNFLWTLLAAAALWAGANPAAWALASTLAASLGLVALTWRLSMRLSGGRVPWAIFAVVLLSLDSAILSYGARGSGMEAAPFAFCALLPAALLWRETGKNALLWRALGGACLAVASLIRPEGMLVAVVLVGVKAWQDRGAGKGWWRLSLATLLPYLAIVGSYQIWRITFYNYLFPNTFYAKTGATTTLIERGLSHFSFFMRDDWLLVPLAAIGIILAVGRRPGSGLLKALAALVSVYTLYIIWTGGDHFPGWRFFVPLIAPLILLAQEALRSGLGHLPQSGIVRRAATVAALIIIAFYVRDTVFLEHPQAWLRERTSLHLGYINRWGTAGLWLRDNTPPGTWTAAKGAGAIAYYSRRSVIDVYGLNDLHIGHLEITSMGEANPGHDKSDPPYVLDKRPDYILDEWLNYFEPVEERLEREYRPRRWRTPTGPELVWWERR